MVLIFINEPISTDQQGKWIRKLIKVDRTVIQKVVKQHNFSAFM